MLKKSNLHSAIELSSIFSTLKKVQSGRDSGLDSNEEEAIRAMISSKKRENKRKISRRSVFCHFLKFLVFEKWLKNGTKAQRKVTLAQSVRSD